MKITWLSVVTVAILLVRGGCSYNEEEEITLNRTARQSCQPSVTTVNGRSACRGATIFEDNFDYIDPGKWSHEVSLSGGGNWEFQVYWADRENSFTRNGNLVIKPRKLADKFGEDFIKSQTLDLTSQGCTRSSDYGCSRTGTSTNYLNPITSARLHTVNTFSFKYGKVEVRAKLPAGDWLWPAIWLLPKTNVYRDWPRSGEIDMMESRGNRELRQGGVNIGVEQFGSALHWGPSAQQDQYQKTHWTKNNNRGYDKDFHNYQLEWTPDKIKFSVDGEQVGEVSPPNGGFWQHGNLRGDNPWAGASKMAPFDQEFYLILNLAVGGTNQYFPDPEIASNPGGKPWRNTASTAPKDFWDGRAQWESTWRGDDDTFQVDYVRVTAL